MSQQSDLTNCPHCGEALNVKVEPDVPIPIGKYTIRWHIFTCRNCGKTVSMILSDVIRADSTGFESK